MENLSQSQLNEKQRKQKNHSQLSQFQFQPVKSQHVKMQAHPIINKLASDIGHDRPHNVLRYIKNWSINQLHQAQQSESDQETAYKVHQNNLLVFSRHKRRNAVFMPQYQQQHYQSQSIIQLKKNQQDKSRILLQLRQIEMLSVFSHQDFYNIMEKMQGKSYKKGQVILQAAVVNDRIFIITKGTVIRTHKSIKRRNQQVRLKHTYQQLHVGQSFCLQSLLYLIASDFSYQANCQQTRVYSIEGHRLSNMVRKHAFQTEKICKEVVTKLQIYDYLDFQEIQKLISIVAIQNTQQNQTIINYSQKLSKTLLVLKGQFILYRKKLSGQFQIYKSIFAGDVYSQGSLKKDEDSQYSIVSKQSGMIGFIHRSALQSCIQIYNKIKMRVKRERQQK